MRAQIRTKLSLAEYAQIMGIHPLHFAQVQFQNDPSNLCDAAFLQYPWQNADAVSRESIAQAIADAESTLEEVLGSRLCPTWEIDEWDAPEFGYRAEMRHLAQPVVKAKWANAITGGVQAKDFLGNVPIAYSDADGDGYKETATVTVNVTFLDECELAVFYPGKNAADEFEIRPVKVSMSGNTITATFRRECAVLEEEYEAFDPGPVDGTDDAFFLSTVDLYRRYNDPQTQVLFMWEQRGAFCNSCGGSGCDFCAYVTQTGCMALRNDPTLSLFTYRPATWDQTTLSFNSAPWAVHRIPDIVRLYYLGGMRDKTLPCSNRLSRDWARTVAYYATSMLDRPLCTCTNITRQFEQLRRDLTLTQGNDDLGFTRDPLGVLDNPLGPRAGAVYAWRRVQNQPQASGAIVT